MPIRLDTLMESRELLELLQCPAFICDESHQILYSNPAFHDLMEMKPRDLKKPVTCAAVLQLQAARMICAADESRRLQDTVTFAEIRGETPRGKKLLLTITSVPLTDAEGTIVGGFQQLLDCSVEEEIHRKLKETLNIERIERIETGIVLQEAGLKNELAGAISKQKGAKILIVDDEKQVRDQAKEVLKSLGFETIIALSGHHAGQMIIEARPDAVLMDIYMTDFDGISLIRTLKKNPKLRDIPVLVLSDSRRPEDISMAVEAGADDYILKPFDDDLLIAKIRRALIPPEERERLKSLGSRSTSSP